MEKVNHAGSHCETLCTINFDLADPRKKRVKLDDTLFDNIRIDQNRLESDTTAIRIDISNIDVIATDFLYRISDITDKGLSTLRNEGISTQLLFQIDTVDSSNKREILVAHYPGRATANMDILSFLPIKTVLRDILNNKWSRSSEQQEALTRALNYISLKIVSFRPPKTLRSLVHEIKNTLREHDLPRPLIKRLIHRVIRLYSTRFPPTLNRPITNTPEIQKTASPNFNRIPKKLIRQDPYLQTHYHHRTDGIWNNRVRLILERGQEFNQLTHWSIGNPGVPFYIRYSNEFADDEGAPTRDALTASFDQLSKLHLISYDHQKGSYRINSLSAVFSKYPELTPYAMQKYIGLGHLLGLSYIFNQQTADGYSTDLPLDEKVFEEIASLIPLIRPLSQAFTQSSRNPISTLVNYAVSNNRDESQSKHLIKILLESQDARDQFRDFLKKIDFKTDCFDDTANANPKAKHAKWIHNLWSRNQTKNQEDKGDHDKDIRIAKSILTKFSDSIKTSYHCDVESAEEILEYITDIAAPKLAVAKGFNDLYKLISWNPYQVPDDIKYSIVQTTTLKDELENYRSNNISDRKFFLDHFQVEQIRSLRPIRPLIIEALQQKLLDLISKEEPNRLRELLCYATGGPNLIFGQKIVLNIIGSYHETLSDEMIARIPLPASHACHYQLDIQVDSLFDRPELPDDFFANSFYRAIALQKKHGDGLS